MCSFTHMYIVCSSPCNTILKILMRIINVFKLKAVHFISLISLTVIGCTIPPTQNENINITNITNNNLDLKIPFTQNEQAKLELDLNIHVIELKMQEIFGCGIVKNRKSLGENNFDECIQKITELPELFVQQLLKPEFVSFDTYEDCKRAVELALRGYCTALELKYKYTSDSNNYSDNHNNNDNDFDVKTIPNSKSISLDEMPSDYESANKTLTNGINWAIGIFGVALLAFGLALIYVCFKKEVILEVNRKMQINSKDLNRERRRGREIPISETEPVVFNQSSIYPGLYSRAQPHSHQEQHSYIALQFKNIS